MQCDDVVECVCTCSQQVATVGVCLHAADVLVVVSRGSELDFARMNIKHRHTTTTMAQYNQKPVRETQA